MGYRISRTGKNICSRFLIAFSLLCIPGSILLLITPLLAAGKRCVTSNRPALARFLFVLWGDVISHVKPITIARRNVAQPMGSVQSMGISGFATELRATLRIVFKPRPGLAACWDMAESLIAQRIQEVVILKNFVHGQSAQHHQNAK